METNFRPRQSCIVYIGLVSHAPSKWMIETTTPREAASNSDTHTHVHTGPLYTLSVEDVGQDLVKNLQDGKGQL